MVDTVMLDAPDFVEEDSDVEMVDAVSLLLGPCPFPLTVSTVTINTADNHCSHLTSHSFARPHQSRFSPLQCSLTLCRPALQTKPWSSCRSNCGSGYPSLGPNLRSQSPCSAASRTLRYIFSRAEPLSHQCIAWPRWAICHLLFRFLERPGTPISSSPNPLAPPTCHLFRSPLPSNLKPRLRRLSPLVLQRPQHPPRAHSPLSPPPSSLKPRLRRLLPLVLQHPPRPHNPL